jgi:hypothetical protein
MRVTLSVVVLLAYAVAVAAGAGLPLLLLDGLPAWAMGLAAAGAIGHLTRRPCGVLVGRLVDAPAG